MKVALLTFHWAVHEGTFLQFYSLYRILEQYHNVTVVNYLPPLSILHEPTGNPGRLVTKEIFKHQNLKNNNAFKILLRTIGIPLFYLVLNERRKKTAYRLYLHKFNLSEPITDINKLYTFIDMFDYVVVGSDQVWNPNFLKYSNYAYLLPFKLNNAQKLAFSASLGIDDICSIPYNMLNIYKRALYDFMFISLREKNHVSFISKLLGKEVFHTLDPTLLLDKKSWENLTSYKDLQENKEYILIYVLDSKMFLNILPLIKYFVNEEHKYDVYIASRLYLHLNKILDILRFTFSPKHLKRLKYVGYTDPFEFLSLVRNAKFVITNSYHGTVFSILFEKQFITLPKHGLNVRMLDLLNILNLEDRFVHFLSTHEVIEKLLKEVDYTTTKSILKFYRRYSLNLIKSALGNEVSNLNRS